MSREVDAQELVRYYRLLRQHGLNDSHSGNASIRVGDSILVTPTGCCADTIEADALITCPLDEKPPPGASLDTPLHLAVHRGIAGVGAVIHSHGPYATAVTFDGKDFSPLDFEGQYYFDRVPVLNIPYDRYVNAAPAAVAQALGESCVVVVRGHGIYARGESLDQAYKWTSSLESSARLSWLRQSCERLPSS